MSIHSASFYLRFENFFVATSKPSHCFFMVCNFLVIFMQISILKVFERVFGNKKTCERRITMAHRFDGAVD
jgi:hypothetical protein